MAGLWSTPMGKAGTVVGGLAAGAPVMAIPGANTLAGAAVGGAALGAMQPVGEGESRLMNTGVGAAGGAVGQGIGGLVASRLAKSTADKATELAAAKTTNAVRDATVQDAQRAGYALPPTQVNPQSPGVANRLLEGLSGKIQTGQAASIKNQGVTNAIARAEAGLSPGQPITPAALDGVRANAGKAYEAVRNVGTVPLGEDFATDFGSSLGPYLQLKAELPSQSIPKVDQLIQDLTRPHIESGTAVDLVKRLRFDGFKNVRAQDPETAMLGRANPAPAWPMVKPRTTPTDGPHAGAADVLPTGSLSVPRPPCAGFLLEPLWSN
jgi:hypothetical protein